MKAVNDHKALLKKEKKAAAVKLEKGLGEMVIDGAGDEVKPVISASVMTVA
jgi:hypothetical protein